MLPETEEDAAAAKLIEFGEAPVGEDQIEQKVREVLEGKAMFDAVSERSKDKDRERRDRRREREKRRTMTKAQIQAEEVRIGLENKLRTNTKARMDPFWTGLAARGGTGSTASGSNIAFGASGASSRSMSLDRDGMTPPRVLAGLKRKKQTGCETTPIDGNTSGSTSSSKTTVPEATTPAAAPKMPSAAMMLVDYGSSDSD